MCGCSTRAWDVCERQGCVMFVNDKGVCGWEQDTPKESYKCMQWTLLLQRVHHGEHQLICVGCAHKVPHSCMHTCATCTCGLLLATPLLAYHVQYRNTTSLLTSAGLLVNALGVHSQLPTRTIKQWPVYTRAASSPRTHTHTYNQTMACMHTCSFSHTGKLISTHPHAPLCCFSGVASQVPAAHRLRNPWGGEM